MIAALGKRLHRVPDLLWMTIICWLGFAVRMVQLGRESLWYDESYSWLNIAATGFWAGLKISLANFVHPPLYYILSRPYTVLGESEWVLRLPALMTGILAIPAIYLLGKVVGGRRLGLFAALLLTLNPFHVWFSREVRSYSLALLLSILIVCFFLRILRGERVWIWFTLFSALGFITHYFCLVLALVQFIYFLLNFRRHYRLFRRWVLSMAIAFLPMLVWLIALFTQEEKMIGISWIPTPRIWSPLVTLWNFSLLTTGQWTVLEVVALPFFIFAFILGLGRSRYRQWLLLWLVVPLVSIMLVSWGTGRNIYVDRYFVICLPAFLLLLALGVLRPHRQWACIGLSAALLAASAVGTARIFVDPHLAKEDWRTAAAVVSEHRMADDLVILRNAEHIIPMTYYHRSDLAPWTYLYPRTEPDPWPAVIGEYGPQRLWLVYANLIGSNHLVTRGIPFDIHTKADRATVDWLATHQEEIVEEWKLSGLTVLLVQFEQ